MFHGNYKRELLNEQPSVSTGSQRVSEMQIPNSPQSETSRHNSHYVAIDQVATIQSGKSAGSKKWTRSQKMAVAGVALALGVVVVGAALSTVARPSNVSALAPSSSIASASGSAVSGAGDSAQSNGMGHEGFSSSGTKGNGGDDQKNDEATQIPTAAITEAPANVATTTAPVTEAPTTVGTVAPTTVGTVAPTQPASGVSSPSVDYECDMEEYEGDGYMGGVDSDNVVAHWGDSVELFNDITMRSNNWESDYTGGSGMDVDYGGDVDYAGYMNAN